MKKILKKLFKSKHEPEVPESHLGPRAHLTCPQCGSTSERFSVGLVGLGSPGERYVRCQECDWEDTFGSMSEFMRLLSGGVE